MTTCVQGMYKKKVNLLYKESRETNQEIDISCNVYIQNSFVYSSYCLAFSLRVKKVCEKCSRPSQRKCSIIFFVILFIFSNNGIKI